MDKLSYSLGGALLVVTLIVLISVSKKPNSIAVKDWSVEKRSIIRLVLSFALMGLLWIIVGFLLTITKAWLEASIWGLFVQFLLIASPGILWWTIFSVKRKRNK